MIETSEQLYQAIEQMGRMQRILESYRNEILTQNPRNFVVLAEGPLEQLRQLAHIGTSTRGFGYDGGILTVNSCPPPVEVNADGDSEFMRAVVVVTEETQKGTARSAQEYINPLLVLSGRQYASISFVELHAKICDALRGTGPRVVAQSSTPDDGVQLVLSDGRVLDTRKR